jgi:dolichol-phosphate mannosyltransferase
MTGEPRKVVTIVVPLLDEQANIDALYSRVAAVFAGTRYDSEFLFVDDGSTDDSLNVIERLAAIHANVRYISFSKNFGHQIAITAGLDNARGDAVIMMDADLQHPPEMIPQMIGLWENGNDIVYTIRKDTTGASSGKSAASDLFYSLFRFFTGVRIPTGAADFRLLDRKVVDALGKIQERTRFLRGLTHWIGFRSVGIEYSAEPRHDGESKYGLLTMLRLAVDGISSFSARPLILSAVAGLLMSLAGGAYLLYILYVHFVGHQETSPGWSSILSVVLLTSGTQLLFLGLIGVYLGKIFNEVKARPLYFVKKSKLD